MKTNEQLIQEITALMADTWLAACERRVIGNAMDGKSHVVLDVSNVRVAALAIRPSFRRRAPPVCSPHGRA
jgi:hypothetical protein